MRALRSRRERLGLMKTPDTYTACMLRFRDSARTDFLSFNAMVRQDLSDAWVHIAVPVTSRKLGTPFLAGIPVIHPTFEFAQAFLKGVADTYPGVTPFCSERMTPEELGKFLLDDIWEAGIATADVEKAWTGIQVVLRIVLGPL